LAWRNFVHAKTRTLLAVAGVAFAVMLMFLQLGFFGSVLTGSTLIYDGLNFDLVIVSREYVFLTVSNTFPRARLHQARGVPGVARTDPLYIGRQGWSVPATGAVYEVLVLGFDPDTPTFLVPEIRRQAELLKRPDSLLVDYQTRPIYGPRERGTTVEIGKRDVTIVGEAPLGTGFAELGIIVVSDVNFVRLMDTAALDDVSVGLIQLVPGADAERAKQELAALLPNDVDVFTREELLTKEKRYWIVHTSTGLILGCGAVVAFVVGVVIMYQALAAQIMRRLSEYATLKAIGFGDGQLAWLVLRQSILLSTVGFLPGLVAALVVYDAIRKSDYVPIEMSWTRVVLVFGISLVMAMAAGLLAVRKIRLADPADLY
jgi:putative ABC transport system permease protein